MDHTIEIISKKLRIYDGILIRVCEYLGLNVYDQTINHIIGSKAVLNQEIVHFLEDNARFFKKYQEDYYSVKDPETIALTINRKKSEVKNYLLNLYPDYFSQSSFIPECSKKLKYMSSYEIDFAIETDNTLKTRWLGKSIWHLGMKQQVVIDHLNSQVPSNPWMR